MARAAQDPPALAQRAQLHSKAECSLRPLLAALSRTWYSTLHTVIALGVRNVPHICN